MGFIKTAAPCEVCGTRVAHHGAESGFIVGYTIKGIQRLVHNRCRSEWLLRRLAIIRKWKELQPHVFRTLNRSLQGRIEQFRKQYEELEISEITESVASVAPTKTPP